MVDQVDIIVNTQRILTQIRGFPLIQLSVELKEGLKNLPFKERLSGVRIKLRRRSNGRKESRY